MPYRTMLEPAIDTTYSQLVCSRDESMRSDSGRRLLSRVSIQSKLLLMLLLTSVLSAAIVGAIGFQSGRNSLRAAVFDRLTEIREAQTRLIETQFADLKNSLVIYTRGSTAITAMDAFSKGFAELNNSTITPQQQQQIVDYYNEQFVPTVQKEADLQLDVAGLLPQSNPQKYLQALYTAPFTADQYSIDMDDAHDKSSWTAAHARFNDFFRQIVTRFDFDDALLIDSGRQCRLQRLQGRRSGDQHPQRPLPRRRSAQDLRGGPDQQHRRLCRLHRLLEVSAGLQ